MIHHRFSTFLFIISLIIVGCQEKIQQSNLALNESEFCFDEKLVSISRNGNNYYIGTESSGHIYLYSSKTNCIVDTFNIKNCGRIYKVKEINNPDSFYVGTQNMGLKKVILENRKNLKIIDNYIIQGKDDRYSCYDIFIDGEVTYAMTSHGIFQVLQSDTLSPVFASLKGNIPDPLVANNMVKESGYLFVATAEGLIRITPAQDGFDLIEIAIKKNFNNVFNHDGFVYALSDSLFKIDPTNLKYVRYSLSSASKYYFYAEGIHYFLNDNYLIFANNETLDRPDKHKHLTTRRKLSIEGHNVIADSPDFCMIVADNALWQVGHHLPGIFGDLKEGGAKLACTDGESVYFLIGQKIYKLKPDNIAEEILELKELEGIRFMECSIDGKYLYFVNSKNEVLRQSFNIPWYQLWSNNPELIEKSEREITAMCFHNSVPGVILGVRDGLICMNKVKDETTIDTLILEKHNGIDSIPYIRRFNTGPSYYYVPTMNEGLFYGAGKKLKILGESDTLKFIRDVAYSQCDSLPYIITNKLLFINRDEMVSNDNYGSRLLVSGNNIYIPGEVRGVRAIHLSPSGKILQDTILFPDIPFKAESSLYLHNIVYLGGQSGVIALNPQNASDYNYNYVKFVDKTVVSRQFLKSLLSIIIIVLTVVVFFWLNESYTTRKRRKNKIQHLAKKFKNWLDEIDAPDLSQQIKDYIDKSVQKESMRNLDYMEKEGDKLSSCIASFLQDKGMKGKEQAEKTSIARQIDRLNIRRDILNQQKSLLQDKDEASQKIIYEIDAIGNEIDNLIKLDKQAIVQDVIDEISMHISDTSKQIAIVTNEHWKKFHQESLSYRLGKLLDSTIFSLLDNNTKEDIRELGSEVIRLYEVSHGEKMERSKEIGQKLDTLTIKATLKLKDVLSEYKLKYENLAHNNESRFEEREINEFDFFQLASAIEFYRQKIETEEYVALYRLIFEDKEDKNFSINYKPIAYELKQTKIIRKIMNYRVHNSQRKLYELKKYIEENLQDIIEIMSLHIREEIKTLEDLSCEKNDEDLKNFLRVSYNNLAEKVESLKDDDINSLLYLIERTNMFDGRVEMFKQLLNIRKLVSSKRLNGKEKSDLEDTIYKFYVPSLAYNVDMDVYDSLLRITMNDKNNPPKGIAGNADPIQQSFFILAVAMAKGEKPEDCESYFSHSTNNASRSRAKGYATKWVNSSYALGLGEKFQDKNNTLYSSVAAYYLYNIAEPAQ